LQVVTQRRSNMAKRKTDLEGRRSFLKGAAGGAAAALVANVHIAKAQQAQPTRVAAAVPSATALAAETGHVSTSVEVLTEGRSGSDYMLEVLQSLGFEYMAANPASSLRGLHESIINLGGNKGPELLTCCHEEQAIAIANGYFKIEGKPMATMVHSTVGLQHASMGIYNAFAGHEPVFIVVGNTIDGAKRRPGFDWPHSAQDLAATVRDCTKWDDQPTSLRAWGESAVRAYQIAVTPPMAPVLIIADSELQENPIPGDAKIHIPKLTLDAPPVGESGAVNELAKLLVNAENPVLMADRAINTQAGMGLLVELAETLQAPVISGRFPSRHPLGLGGGPAIRNADVILAMEVRDLYGTIYDFRDQLDRESYPLTKPGVKLATISISDLPMRSNYQDFERYTEVDIAIAGDVEATLPALIEACRKLITADRKLVLEERGKKIALAHHQENERARTSVTYAWDASPVSWARLSAELWDKINGKDWSMVGGGASRQWKIDKVYQTIPGGGAAGMGYGPPGAVGAALANRKYGRLSVSIQGDGDLMYSPGAFWTAAHHRIPLLTVMHNNRAYHQERMHVQRMANRHQRGIENAGIGTTLTDPNIDYATMARSMGLHGEGPITNPNDLGPALERAIASVEKGEPALVDVFTQPR
jgi:acetolactate synthase-1/2/3 large subunit